ncbi:MAG: vanadium-dependent haloperoxidase [Bacteroidia bacterium]
MKKLSLILLLALLLVQCKEKSANEHLDADAQILIECNKNLTTAQVERHFTPPVAARNYAYPNVAAYTALQAFYSDYKSLSGQLKEMNIDVKPNLDKEYDLELVAFNSFTQVALQLVYGDTIVSNYRKNKLLLYQSQLQEGVFARSMEYSDEVAKEILAWADKDMYKETRNFGEFQTASLDGHWKPTSPDYMPAIEPHWNKIRPFVLDSANQFEPDRPTEYNKEEGSPFYEETLEVMEVVNNADEEDTAIAQFWDCNPNISHHHGHFMFFLQKISPGGHWVHIALQTLDAENMTIMEGAATMSLVGISLHDAFIACWTEKYNSNYIRPETVIKDHLDKDWEPILQTPAFPEYPSGHSVASASAATVLTAHIGDNYEFTDSTEVPFGLPRRSFKSFRAASDEAAISRLYGGIHFMPAIDNGITMGNQVGELVLSRVKFKSNK